MASLTPFKEVLAELQRLGLRGSLRKIMDMNTVRCGTLVGVDELGNKYFERMDELSQPFRYRWVEYNTRKFDASQIPAQWHGWIHCSTDKPDVPAPFYKITHKPNLSGTDECYKNPGHVLHPEYQAFREYSNSRIASSWVPKGKKAAPEL
eukprot:GILI01000776.1.p2 GENE.GILI01000776.1~~GILI01000776.1.p2  ORF type:complete len:150 (+),score=56.26 GILI01000776.1:102-551(+)